MRGETRCLPTTLGEGGEDVILTQERSASHLKKMEIPAFRGDGGAVSNVVYNRMGGKKKKMTSYAVCLPISTKSLLVRKKEGRRQKRGVSAKKNLLSF